MAMAHSFQARPSKFGRSLLLALLSGGLLLFAFLGLWFGGRSGARPDEPRLVRHFRANRTDFEDFVSRYRGLAKGENIQCPKSFDLRDWVIGFESGHYPHVTLEGDCVVLRWWWAGPINGDSDRYLINSPRGTAGLSAEYQESKWADGTPRCRVVSIDATWVYVKKP
jgi:hypothetical protein